jgi:hypothetical protein
MSQKQNDPWREELNALIFELKDGVDSIFQQWIDANETDDVSAAALSFSPERGIEKSRSTIKQIEVWYRKQHNAAITEVGNLNKINPKKWIIIEEHWIEKEVMNNLTSLQRALSEFKLVIADYATFNRENSGVMGFTKNFARGWFNPVDGIADLFGEGSLSRSSKSISARLSSAADACDTTIAELLSAVDEAVVNHWNEKTVGCINEIKESARRRSEETTVETSSPVYAHPAQIQTVKKVSPWWFLLGGISAGLVVLGGIVALKYFGFF